MGNHRKRFSEMTEAELIEYERTQNYQRGRMDAFLHGKPETVLEYWERQEPNHDELLSIVKNLLKQIT